MDYTINEHNILTDEYVARPATEEEIAQLEADLVEKEAMEAEQKTKAEAKAALLERLGITADEATLLLR
jgi:ribosomal protein L9